jgi:hypothetical protein
MSSLKELKLRSSQEIALYVVDLTKCNGVPIGIISSGLPLKEKKMLDVKTIQSEKGMRDLIARNLRKEIHPGQSPRSTSSRRSWTRHTKMVSRMT